MRDALRSGAWCRGLRRSGDDDHEGDPAETELEEHDPEDAASEQGKGLESP